jgi:hypothetical protein
MYTMCGGQEIKASWTVNRQRTGRNLGKGTAVDTPKMKSLNFQLTSFQLHPENSLVQVGNLPNFTLFFKDITVTFLWEI